MLKEVYAPATMNLCGAEESVLRPDDLLERQMARYLVVRTAAFVVLTMTSSAVMALLYGLS